MHASEGGPQESTHLDTSNLSRKRSLVGSSFFDLWREEQVIVLVPSDDTSVDSAKDFG